MVRKIQKLVIIFFAVFSSFVFAADFCVELLNEMSGQVFNSQDEVLNLFTIEGLKFRNAHELSTGVYRVPHKNGFQYVVRVEDSMRHNVAFEEFAGEFMADLPGVSVAKARVVTAKEGRGITKGLSLFPRPKVSIANYYPIPVGKTYFNSARIENHERLRGTLNHIVGPLSVYQFGDARCFSIQECLRYCTAEDMKTISEFSKVSLKDFPQRLQEYVLEGHLEAIEALTKINLSRLPADIRTKLADHWVGRYLLGLSDFHSRNFLLKDNKIISIDLAEVTDDFNEGASQLKRAHTPFPLLHSEGTDSAQMMQWVSPEMREYLRLLSRETIDVAAARVHYKVKPIQRSGILKRREHLLGSQKTR